MSPVALWRFFGSFFLLRFALLRETHSYSVFPSFENFKYLWLVFRVNIADRFFLGRGWGEQLLQIFKQHGDLPVMPGYLARQILVGGENPADFDESAHDSDVYFRCAITFQYAGEHSDALLGESVGRASATAAPLCCCSLQEQRVELSWGQLKNEVFRKSAVVASNRKVQIACRHAVKIGQVRIEHNAFAPDHVDAAGDVLSRNNRTRPPGSHYLRNVQIPQASVKDTAGGSQIRQ